MLDRGGGGDGRVWIATTPQGKVCVLKFCCDEQALEKEKKAVGGCLVKLSELKGQKVLIMPWVKPCTKEDLQKNEVKTAIVKAVQKLAKAGNRHDDLFLHHVGLYKKNRTFII